MSIPPSACAPPSGRPGWRAAGGAGRALPADAAARAAAYARANAGRFVEELRELVRFPSVGSEPAHAADVRRCAGWLAAHLGALGLGARLVETGGHSLVRAEWRGAPGRPTLLVYGHYDVQPADPADGWRTPPFEPVVRGDALHGRGASDDKGQLWAHVKAAECWLRTVGRLPLNLVFLFEGEEESGSRGMLGYLARCGPALGADVAVVSDMAMRDARTPAITLSERGTLGVEVEVAGAPRELHSGVFGGAVANPVHALAGLVARLHDGDGRIAIPGFYDGIDVPPPAERAALRRAGPADEEILHDAGVSAGAGERGWTEYERTTLRPSADVHGISGGYAGEGTKAVIPTRATVRLSFRLAPGQDPARVERLFRRWVASAAREPGIRVAVRTLSRARPVRVDPRHPAIAAAAAAARDAFGRAPVFVRSGGTLPVAAVLSADLGLPVVLMGFALRDDGMHAPNEKLHLPNFHRGVQTSIRLMERLARLPSTSTRAARRPRPA